MRRIGVRASCNGISSSTIFSLNSCSQSVVSGFYWLGFHQVALLDNVKLYDVLLRAKKRLLSIREEFLRCCHASSRR